MSAQSKNFLSTVTNLTSIAASAAAILLPETTTVTHQGHNEGSETKTVVTHNPVVAKNVENQVQDFADQVTDGINDIFRQMASFFKKAFGDNQHHGHNHSMRVAHKPCPHHNNNLQGATNQLRHVCPHSQKHQDTHPKNQEQNKGADPTKNTNVDTANKVTAQHKDEMHEDDK